MTPPAIAALLIGTWGALMTGSARTAGARGALGAWSVGLGVIAAGLVAVITVSGDATDPARALGTTTLLIGGGLVWSAACRFGRGWAPRPTAAAAGALAWLGFNLADVPSAGWRVWIGAGILMVYGLGAARELMRRRTGEDPGPVATRTDGGPTFRDPLTGVGNGAALGASGAALLVEAETAGRPLTLLTMGVDGLTAVNRLHGAAAGDGLLVAFARLAHDYLPPTSLVCRRDGDVFAAMLPGAGPDRARAVADELRALFAHLRLRAAGGPLSGTVSIGIAEARPGRGLAELLLAADRCLLAAKHVGRDCVVDERDLAEAAALAAA